MNINELFKDPKKALHAAKSSLAKTELGRAGAVRVEIEPTTGKIVYISSVDGEKFSSAGEAFIQSKKFFLTDYKELRYGASQSGSEFYQSRFSQAGMFLEGLQDKLANADAGQKASLQRIGLGGIDSNSLMMQVLTTKSETGRNSNQAAKELEKLGIGFVPIVDGEGGTLLTMKALVGGEQRALSSAQIHMMSVILGSGFLNADKLQSALGDAAMPGFVNKLPKRLRAFFSERDVVMSEEDIAKALPKLAAGSMEDNVLRVDSGIDYLRKYIGHVGREGMRKRIY
jgi:hypothetical protein